MLYSWTARVFALAATLRLLWLGRRDPRFRGGLAQRFGYGPRAGHLHTVWIHAVSVGEVQAAVPLVAELRARRPAQRLLLTSGTATGLERARAALGADIELRYAPFDVPGSVRRFLARTEPAVAIFLETELWPNLVAAVTARKVPLVLASGRVSARSVRRYLRFARALMARTLQGFAAIAAQTAPDAERFVALGAHAERVKVLGNLKFDITLPEDLQTRSTALRARYLPAGARPVWVAGSTHPVEEELLLRAHREVLREFPDALLVMAPRHPQRFDAAADAVSAAGLSCLRRSRDASGEGAAPVSDPQVLLLDTLGELLAAYALADVVFTGGSLVPVGGHNLLEPAAVGRALLAGPHLFNAPQVAALLQEAGALQIVRTDHELAHALSGLLRDPPERARRGALALGVLQANRGTAARVVNLLETLLPR